VSLDPLHKQIARIAFALPEAGQVALAGGGAMLAHDHLDVIGGRLPTPLETAPRCPAQSAARLLACANLSLFPSLAISGCRGRTPAGARLAHWLARGAVRGCGTCAA
jgi:hypothetical protein